MTTICQPLKSHVIRNGICVNCGGKGGTPGPCKTSFDESEGAEFKDGEGSGGGHIRSQWQRKAEEQLGKSRSIGEDDPDRFLSQGEQQELDAIASKLLSTVKLPKNLSTLSPGKIDTFRDSLFTGAHIGLVGQADMSEISEMNKNGVPISEAIKAVYQRKTTFSDGTPISEDSPLRNPVGLSGSIKKTGNFYPFSMPGGKLSEGFMKETGLKTPNNVLDKHVKMSGGKFYQSPYMTAFQNRIESSSVFKAIDSARESAVDRLNKADPTGEKWAAKYGGGKPTKPAKKPRAK